MVSTKLDFESCFVKSALAPCHTIEGCASDRCGLMGINRKFGLPLCPSFRIGPNRKSILLGGVFLATGTKSAQNLCGYDSSEGYLSIYTSERKLLAEFTNISKQESTFHFVFGIMDHPCCLLKHVYIMSNTVYAIYFTGVLFARISRVGAFREFNNTQK